MLEHTLKENWPLSRVLVSCEVCECELFDTKKETPAIGRPSYVATLIKTFARKHRERTGHANLNVSIDGKPEPVEEIDVTITINE